MKRVLLIGCGSEIGINLLLLNNPSVDGFVIDTVFTHPPATDSRYAELKPIHGIYARAAIAQPALIDTVSISSDKTIEFGGRAVTMEFIDIAYDDISSYGKFDAAILATSKEDIDTREINNKYRSISDAVLGVAESDKYAGIYPCLLGLRSQFPVENRLIEESGLYCIGSCQTNGMHASLRLVVMALARLGLNAKAVLSVETDIIHPDTPTGVLGTKSFEGRLQDCRDNLRPSFSQIKKSMDKVMPWSSIINTVSLRAPVHAPGYQINRFIVADDHRLTKKIFVESCSDSFNRYPSIVKGTDLPLGSRAYSFEARCSTVLFDDHHFIIHRPDFLKNMGLSEIIIQSFVNNTLGYSANVLNGVSHVLKSGRNTESFF